MKKLLSTTFTIVSILAVIWIIISIINTNACNDPFSVNYKDYASWNLFQMLYQIIG